MVTKARMKVLAKKQLAKSKVQLARFKVKAKRELGKMAVRLRMHQAALKVAAKRYQRSMKAQKKAAAKG